MNLVLTNQDRIPIISSTEVINISHYNLTFYTNYDFTVLVNKLENIGYSNFELLDGTVRDISKFKLLGVNYSIQNNVSEIIFIKEW